MDVHSPRYVAIANETILPKKPTLWVKPSWEDGRINENQKVLVIFSPGNTAQYSPQVRLYQLDPHAGELPPAFLVQSSDAERPASSHVIHEELGIRVYVSPASRRRRVEWQLQLVSQKASWGNVICALIELDHLIFHRCMAGESEPQEIERDYEKLSKLKALALSTDKSGERTVALEKALAIACRIAGLPAQRQ